MRRLRFFLTTEMGTECEICDRRFDIVSGGVCASCRRMLCAGHLHGSWFRRLATDFGARVICVECRAKGAAPNP